MFYSGLQYGVGRVEVAVREPIAHTRHLVPRDRELAAEELCWQRLDGLAYFDETHPDRIKHQAVCEIASFEVLVDGFDGRSDVVEAPLVTASQRVTGSANAVTATSGLRSAAGTRSTDAPSSDSS